jgi:hypothetical protein
VQLTGNISTSIPTDGSGHLAFFLDTYSNEVREWNILIEYVNQNVYARFHARLYSLIIEGTMDQAFFHTVILGLDNLWP